MNRRELWVPREVWNLRGAVRELLDAHEAFDQATFYGTMGDINDAQGRMEVARRRTRLASLRLDGAMRDFQALDALLDEPDDGFNCEEEFHS